MHLPWFYWADKRLAHLLRVQKRSQSAQFLVAFTRTALTFQKPQILEQIDEELRATAEQV